MGEKIIVAKQNSETGFVFMKQMNKNKAIIIKNITIWYIILFLLLFFSPLKIF